MSSIDNLLCRISKKNFPVTIIAFCIIQVDGLTPSDDFLELVEKEKNGSITTADMKEVLDKKYKVKESDLNVWSICLSRYRYPEDEKKDSQISE